MCKTCSHKNEARVSHRIRTARITSSARTSRIAAWSTGGVRQVSESKIASQEDSISARNLSGHLSIGSAR